MRNRLFKPAEEKTASRTYSPAELDALYCSLRDKIRPALEKSDYLGDNLKLKLNKAASGLQRASICMQISSMKRALSLASSCRLDESKQQEINLLKNKLKEIENALMYMEKFTVLAVVQDINAYANRVGCPFMLTKENAKIMDERYSEFFNRSTSSFIWLNAGAMWCKLLALCCGTFVATHYAGKALSNSPDLNGIKDAFPFVALSVGARYIVPMLIIAGINLAMTNFMKNRLGDQFDEITKLSLQYHHAAMNIVNENKQEMSSTILAYNK